MLGGQWSDPLLRRTLFSQVTRGMVRVNYECQELLARGRIRLFTAFAQWAMLIFGSKLEGKSIVYRFYVVNYDLHEMIHLQATARFFSPITSRPEWCWVILTSWQ